MILEFLILATTILSIYILHLTKNGSGHFILLTPFTIFTSLFPSIPHINQAMPDAWKQKFKLFESFNSTVIAFHSITGGSQAIVADAAAAKLVFDNKIFGKPIEDYSVLSFFGPNVVTTEGPEWRRHRKLTAPAFSEKNNESVWENSSTLITEWFTLLEKQQKTGLLENSTVMTLRLALMIISSAAFGIKCSWSDSDTDQDPPRPGRKLSFLTCLEGITAGTIIKLTFPDWLYKLPFKFPRYVQLCFNELELTLKDMIIERREQKLAGIEHSDLFSRLLIGDEDDKVDSLSTEEIVGNTYIFLLAGHETSAHTLAFAFTLLALYPEHQESIYQEALSAFGDRESTYSDYNSLPYTLAVFLEVLRFYPPVLFIPRIALEDTTLPASTCKPGEEPVSTEILIKKGTRVAITPGGLHFNPKYYGPNPHEFKPSRFIDTETTKWNRDAFVPFAGGARQCIGQKFAFVESVAVLSNLCLNYEILIPENVKESYALRVGESEEDRRERIFAVKHSITLTPGGNLPLTFRKRKSL